MARMALFRDYAEQDGPRKCVIQFEMRVCRNSQPKSRNERLDSMITTGQLRGKLVISLLAVALFGGFPVPSASPAAEVRENHQVEQAPASWIGQKVVTKFAAPVKSDGKVEKAIADYTEAIRLDPKNAGRVLQPRLRLVRQAGLRQGHR